MAILVSPSFSSAPSTAPPCKDSNDAIVKMDPSQNFHYSDELENVCFLNFE